jgi:hypothetical protein
VQGVAGVTALGESVMYRVLQGYCDRRVCDVKCVVGGNALGEGVICRVLQGY